jgi:hypothetical protein
VQAQKPADGESESFRNLEATNYKKEAGQGQTNSLPDDAFSRLAFQAEEEMNASK